MCGILGALDDLLLMSEQPDTSANTSDVLRICLGCPGSLAYQEVN